MNRGLVVLGMSLGSAWFFLAGCQSYEPPSSPVAYVFPTVRDFESMGETVERTVTVSQVRDWLERAGVWGDLVSAGMDGDACSLVVRGLKRSGYAEIDARKSSVPMKWVSLSSLPGNRLEVMVGYGRDRGTGMRAGMWLLGNVPSDTRRRCQISGKEILRVWRGIAGDTEREYVELCAPGGVQADFWLKRLQFWEPGDVSSGQQRAQ